MESQPASGQPWLTLTRKADHEGKQTLNLLRRNESQAATASAQLWLTLTDTMKTDHEGTRTLNLLIRSQTPYPLGHAVPVGSSILSVKMVVG